MHAERKATFPGEDKAQRERTIQFLPYYEFIYELADKIRSENMEVVKTAHPDWTNEQIEVEYFSRAREVEKDSEGNEVLELD